MESRRSNSIHQIPWPLILLALVVVGAAPTTCTDQTQPGDQCQAWDGSAASPLNWMSEASWSCGHIPGYADDVQIAEGNWVECGRNQICIAKNVRVEGAASGLVVRGELFLTGCNDAVRPSGYANPMDAPCGAWDGAAFHVQGELLYDSTVDDDLLARGVAVVDKPGILRLALSAPLSVAPRRYDVFQIRSGPERNHVYEVANYDGNPAAPALDLRLYNPQMSYRSDPQTRDALIDLRFFDGGNGEAQGSLVRVAARSDPRFESDDLARCVQLCKAGSGVPFTCTDSSTLKEEVSPAGWFLGLGSAEPADPTAVPGRRLITEVRNDVAGVIEGTAGVWDLVCLAEPLPDALFADRTGPIAMPASLWPGFQPGDAWRLFRPARVVYGGGMVEPGDGMLSFFSSCLDTDYASFVNFARVFTVEGTPACQRPFQDTVFISWEEGRPGLLTNTASAGGCNGEQPNIQKYSVLAGDRVAIIDTRSPTDTSATCDRNGAQAGGFGDGDPLGSTHGVSIYETRFDPNDAPKDWFFRYLGDDGALISKISWPNTSYVLDGWTFWYNRRSNSTNVVDIAMLDAADNLTVTLRNARVTNWTSIDKNWCNPALYLYPAIGESGATAVPNTAAVKLEDVLYIDTHRQGMIHGAPGPRSSLDAVLAFGRDTRAIPVACAVMQSGSVRNSWIDGWSYLVRFGNDVVQTRFRAHGLAAPLSIVSTANLDEPVVIENSMLLDLRSTSLGLDGVREGTLDVSHNRLRWLGTPPLTAIGRFLSPSAPSLVAVEGNLVEGPALIGCENANWAAANAGAIGPNLIVPTGGLSLIQGAWNCPGAAALQIQGVPGQVELEPDQPGLTLDGMQYGPVAPVGVPLDAKLYDLGAFTTPFLISPAIPE